jgi:queuine/archaeosine tRNA-ribosyltransferase
MINIGQKIWHFCHTLRDEGMSYGNYIEQLTYLLFLKMAAEKDADIPHDCTWNDLIKESGEDLMKKYDEILDKLAHHDGILGDIFANAKNLFRKPVGLKKIIDMINEIDWGSIPVDQLGTIYEDLLQRYAEEKKGGAGQYFTPRPLIDTMVRVMKPKIGISIHDPACGTGGFLISAYDIHKEKEKDKLIINISQVTENSHFTLIDSGHYEKFWNNDKEWSANKYKSVLKDIKIDMCFSHDVYWELKKKVNDHIQETVTNTALTASFLSDGEVIPIIHGTPENFVSIIKGVIKGIEPQIIGITERELGSSLLERAETLSKIRKEVDKLRDGIVIHLLGTGNPASILIYSLCGADTFDALEWCKNVVDPKTGHLYHFTQRDLIQCNCKACLIKDIPYHVATMSHNLIFYEGFMSEVRNGIAKDKIITLLNKYLPKHVIPKVKKIMV